MSILVISSSLSPDSKSRIVANEMNACLKSAGANPEFMQNATTPTKSIVGFAVFLTIIAVLLIDPLLNIISTLVSNSGF